MAKARLLPVSPEQHLALGLLPGWTFFHAPHLEDIPCWLCRRTSAYVRLDDDGELRGHCYKHARDF